ncbi:hypothetical protein TrRE_jg7256, partial [Triparma retinervis]
MGICSSKAPTPTSPISGGPVVPPPGLTPAKPAKPETGNIKAPHPPAEEVAKEAS